MSETRVLASKVGQVCQFCGKSKTHTIGMPYECSKCGGSNGVEYAYLVEQMKIEELGSASVLALKPTRRMGPTLVPADSKALLAPYKLPWKR